MSRKYHSRRREASAEQTRQAIVEAAVALHGKGITALAAVAEEAGVSLPTVNKYFPTREDLFHACTSHVETHLQYQVPETLAAIREPGERLRQVVTEAYRLHELTFGQVWTGYRLEDESPVLAGATRNYEALVASLADTLPYDRGAGDPDTLRRFVLAALSPLTYRALRLKNGLSAEKAAEYMTVALAALLNVTP